MQTVPLLCWMVAFVSPVCWKTPFVSLVTAGFICAELPGDNFNALSSFVPKDAVTSVTIAVRAWTDSVNFLPRPSLQANVLLPVFKQ